MSNSKISWYVNRLKAMSLPEINHRIKKKIKMKAEEKYYANDTYINSNNNINTKKISEFETRLDEIINIDIIDLERYIANDSINVFNSEIDLTSEINWHICNISQWDTQKYSNSINFKNCDDIGDVRYTWELNRHLFLPKLALNYKKTNDKKYIDMLEMHFYSWINKNPFMKGVNWASPMEIAIRSYQWLITLSIIKGKISQEFKVDIINSIITSIKYVDANYSLYSSANNHLIIEAIYSGIIGYTLEPIYKNDYFQKSYIILQDELLLQNNKDGVNKEHATHYQAFVLDGYLQYLFFLKKIGKKLSHEEILFNMAEFIGLLNQSGEVIEFGDSDDAKLISFNLETKQYYEYVLQLASVYFGTNLTHIDSLFEEVKFISGEKEVKNELYKYKQFKVYEEGGYVVFNFNEDFMLFDVADLGFGSIAAHGHADSLSVVYSVNRQPFFVDTGTYIYNVESEWRDYFRETSSHNTLMYDKRNQSEIKGPFLWGKKAKSSFIDYGENNEIAYVSAKHIGYSPYTHIRSITYIKKNKAFIIEDKFDKHAEINYILDNSADIEMIGEKNIRITNNNEEIYLYVSNDAKITEKWMSKQFLSKIKTKGIKVEHDFEKYKCMYTIIAKEKISFEDNTIGISKLSYKYNTYKDIRR